MFTVTYPGIVKYINGKPEMEEKIQVNLGRKTAYYLMWAVFMGGGGVKTFKNSYILSTFFFQGSFMV